jgi:hypothetical protein
MKKQAMVVVLLTVFALVGLSAGIAQAVDGWHTCSITYVGSTGSGYLIKASDTAGTPDFTNIIFVIDPYSGKGKEQYAAALTAFANSSNVQLYLVAPFTDYTVAWGTLATK